MAFLEGRAYGRLITKIGKMTIDIPNGLKMSKLQLTEVLYSPEVGYTLVSIGNLNGKGSFGGGKCVIVYPNGERVGEVLKIKKDYIALSMIAKWQMQQWRNLHWISYTAKWGIYSGSKNCSNVCSFFNDCIGTAC